MNPVNSRARIVGGRKSQKGWWPWQIGLHKVGKMYEMTSFSIIKHQEGGGTFVIFFPTGILKKCSFYCGLQLTLNKQIRCLSL